LVVLPRTVTWLTTDARCKATSGRPENEEDRRHDDERDDDRTGVGESSGVVRRRAVVPRGGAAGEVRQDVGGPAADGLRGVGRQHDLDGDRDRLPGVRGQPLPGLTGSEACPLYVQGQPLGQRAA
jgi:hypothetical protein